MRVFKKYSLFDELLSDKLIFNWFSSDYSVFLAIFDSLSKKLGDLTYKPFQKSSGKKISY